MSRDRVTPVSIRGRGVAAYCSARLLTGLNLDWTFQAETRSSAPALLLSDPALALMRDCLGEPALLAGRRRVLRRIVAWGGREPAGIDHGAIVLHEGELEAALAVEAGSPGTAPSGAPFAIHAAVPFPEPELRRFGTRSSYSARVVLLREEDASACWIEAVDTGWLFLIPTSKAEGWLLAVGAPADELLVHSGLIAPRVRIKATSAVAFETAPRMLARLSGPAWLACGTEAIAFDPICGDGTAQAVREALLAAAVVRALADGEDPQALATHYHSMLMAAMRRHLRLCAQFYADGGNAPWWQEQLASLAEGFDWCTAQLATQPEPAYVLQGSRLVRREAVL